jgi:outer membrane protein TolC
MNPSDPLSAAPIDIPQALSRTVRAGAAMAVAAALSGCASFSSDGGISVAAGIAAHELKKDTVVIREPEDASSARDRVEHLLKRPLTADAAVQIALLNNRGLQAAYNELGIAEAMLVQSSLPPNPSFSFSRISGSLESELEGTIAANILALATLSARAEIAADRFPMVEQDAISRRIDLQIARIELEALAKSGGLTNATRFVHLFQLSGIYKDTRESVGTENVQFRDFGAGATVEIPIFDFGEVRVRQAEQTYMRAVNRLAEMAVNARSQARDAYRVYRSTFDIASHYQREILPLRKIISDETLLRYNAMLIDVFPLIDEARRRILATTTAIEAKRDFWIAKTDLQVAIIGGGGVGSGVERSGLATMRESGTDGLMTNSNGDRP